jgi:hypothetical protein
MTNPASALFTLATFAPVIDIEMYIQQYENMFEIVYILKYASKVRKDHLHNI